MLLTHAKLSWSAPFAVHFGDDWAGREGQRAAGEQFLCVKSSPASIDHLPSFLGLIS